MSIEDILAELRRWRSSELKLERYALIVEIEIKLNDAKDKGVE